MGRRPRRHPPRPPQLPLTRAGSVASASRRELRIAPRAEIEIADAVAWYEAQRAGLSIEFVHALDQAFMNMSERPASFRAVRSGIRRALLGRFPYGVFFADDDSSVTVLAVIHASRHPRLWPSRPAR